MAKPLPKVTKGMQFGRLTVLGPPVAEGRYLRAPVRCACGNKGLVEQASLYKGVSLSCGCLRAEMTSERFTTHGMRAHRMYPVWNSMVQRCTNPNNPGWANYGGRGVTVCKRWLQFENFLADMGEPPDDAASIERKNNSKGYTKGNCRWATRKEQARNKSNNRMFFYQGKERCVAEISELTGMAYMKLYQRLHTYGWPIEKAVQP